MDKEERIKLALQLQEGFVVVNGLSLEDVKEIPVECAISPRDVRMAVTQSGFALLQRHDQGAVRYWRYGRRRHIPQRKID